MFATFILALFWRPMERHGFHHRARKLHRYYRQQGALSPKLSMRNFLMLPYLIFDEYLFL